MRFNLLCVLVGMHTFLVRDQNSDKPYYQCQRCGKTKPFEPLVSERFLGPGGGGVAGLGG